MANINEFTSFASDCKKNFVALPYTLQESIFAKNAYTTKIQDCTTCGITDGKGNVLLMHLCPSIVQNMDFHKIEQFIKEKFGNKLENIQAILIGSKPEWMSNENSPKLFDNFVKFFESNNIPCSIFKGGKAQNHVAYNGITDEWVIANSENKKSYSWRQKSAIETANNIFDTVKISTKDTISWF